MADDLAVTGEQQLSDYTPSAMPAESIAAWEATSLIWHLLVVACFLQVPEAGPSERRIEKLDVGPARITIDAPPAIMGPSDDIEYNVTLLAPVDGDLRWPRHVLAEGPRAAKVVGSRTLGPDRIDRFVVRRWFLQVAGRGPGELLPGHIVVEVRTANANWETRTIELPTVRIAQAGESIREQFKVPFDAVPAKTVGSNARDGYFLAGALVLTITLLAWAYLRQRPTSPSP